MTDARRPVGIVVVTGFFALATVISLTAAISLLTPGGVLEPMWRINPSARAGFESLGGWAPALLLSVSAACGCSVAGLWRGARWGWRLAVAVLAVNLAGDAINAV